MSAITGNRQLDQISLFPGCPNELIINVLSYLDVKDHGKAARLNSLFNHLVNSGAEKGKNAKAYLIGKIKQIDFTFTKKDILKLFFRGFPFEKMSYSLREPFCEEMYEILYPNFLSEVLDNVKKLAIVHIKEFISKDAQLSNIKLANFIHDPNSEESQIFIKELAIKTLQIILPTLEDEKQPQQGREISNEQLEKLYILVNKYLELERSSGHEYSYLQEFAEDIQKNIDMIEQMDTIESGRQKITRLEKRIEEITRRQERGLQGRIFDVFCSILSTLSRKNNRQ